MGIQGRNLEEEAGVDLRQLGKVAKQQTLNSTPVNIGQVPVRLGAALLVEATVTAKIPGTASSVAVYKRRGLFENTGGTVSIIGAIQDAGTIEDAAINAADVDLVVDGTNAAVEVTGIAATTVDFEARVGSIVLADGD